MSGSEGDPAAPAVLALDATGGLCAVALLRPDGGLLQRAEPMARGHAERLFPLIEAVLAEAGLTASELDLIAAARGPGSFTGVRIGVAAARGLALAAGARAVGVDGFHAIAAAAQAAGLRARRALAVFGKPPRLVARPFALTASGVQALSETAPLAVDDGVDLLIGPGAEAAAELFAGGGLSPACDPRFAEIDVARAARLAAAGGPGVDAPKPLYLRPPDAQPSSEARPRRLGPRPSA